MRVVLCCIVVLALIAGASAINLDRAFSRGPAKCQVPPEMDGDQPCKAKKGTCFFVNSCKCNGAVESKLCGGAAGRKCCVGTLEANPADTNFLAKCGADQQTAADDKCAKLAAGARCVDSTKCGCDVAFVSGKCGGSAARKCCPGKVVQEDNRADVDPRVLEPPRVAPVKGRLGIKCSTLFSTYPQGESAEVVDRILNNTRGQNGWITNTCAFRMSYTLSKLGVSLPQKTGADGGKLRLTTGDKHYLYFRVAVLDQFMREKFGQPAKEVTRPGTGRDPATLGVKPEEFSSVKGIIRFNIPIWDDASGHFDLWDGNNMLESHHNNPDTKKRYFDNARSVAVWVCDP